MDTEEFEGCHGSCEGCSACGHDEAFDFDEEMSPIITLTDEDGTDVKFEILDVVTLDEKEYLVVTEVNEESDEISDNLEVLILEIKEENGEEVYDTVTDDKIAENVFNEFQKQQEELGE